jgi:hypothetical protein
MVLLAQIMLIKFVLNFMRGVIVLRRSFWPWNWRVGPWVSNYRANPDQFVWKTCDFVRRAPKRKSTAVRPAGNRVLQVVRKAVQKSAGGVCELVPMRLTWPARRVVQTRGRASCACAVALATMARGRMSVHSHEAGATTPQLISTWLSQLSLKGGAPTPSLSMKAWGCQV